MSEPLHAVSIDPILKTVSHIQKLHKEISYVLHELFHVFLNYYFLQIFSRKFYIRGVFRLYECGSELVMLMM